jgi:DNA-binding NarL/FixJ family response regulator
MLTVHDSDDRLLEAVKSGADGFLSKNAHSQAVLEAARGVLRGEAAISKYKVTKLCAELGRLSRLESRRFSSRLTPRETQILQKIAEGLSNKEIARTFVLSESTVKTHVSHILEKLQVHTRYQAAAYVQGLKPDRNRVDHHKL